MKKRIAAWMAIGTMAFGICICGPQSQAAEQAFSFEDLKNVQFTFSSGAGGWATMLAVREDGSFSGEYFDGEMGDTGDAYPNGTMYESRFDGQFTEPLMINENTYSMQIEGMNYENEIGSEEIRDGVRYQYSEAYGLNGAENFLLYLPGTLLTDLPEELRSWIGYPDLSNTEETVLPFYALYNEVQGCGFSSYDIVESLREMVASTEDAAALLEQSIQHDPLSQAELNEKTGELYELWDLVLNHIWSVLQATRDEETMKTLTEKELAWIAEKEAAIDAAGAQAEGGSMQPMLRNQRAAEMTKEQVFELMKLFES